MYHHHGECCCRAAVPKSARQLRPGAHLPPSLLLFERQPQDCMCSIQRCCNSLRSTKQTIAIKQKKSALYTRWSLPVSFSSYSHTIMKNDFLSNLKHALARGPSRVQHCYSLCQYKGSHMSATARNPTKASKEDCMLHLPQHHHHAFNNAQIVWRY